jgi:hypothetical protein
MLRRQRVLFETALESVRKASVPGDSEAAIARAVLLYNYGREAQALERANDALKVTYLHTFRAWLRLVAPADGILTSTEVNRILHDFEPAFEMPVEDFNTFFVRALLYAGESRWDEARQELRTCRRKLGKSPLPTQDGTYATWLEAANAAPSAASDTKFRDATLDVLWNLAVPDELRISLAQEVLQLWSRPELAGQEKLKPEEIASGKGRTHFRLARSYSQKNDKASVLKHLEEVLKLKLADLQPAALRNDNLLQGWNNDEDFKKLYKKYES